jgi:hypothetical protein
MTNKVDKQVEVLKVFGIKAERRYNDRLGIDGADSYLGEGVSLTTASGDVMLALSGKDVNLEGATKRLVALTRGIAILEALKDIN